MDTGNGPGFGLGFLVFGFLVALALLVAFGIDWG